MLPESVKEAVRCQTGKAIRHYRPLGGGCIANAGQAETEAGACFLKWSLDRVGETFPAEAKGLEALKAAGSGLVVPGVYGVKGPQPAFLLLEWLPTGPQTPRFWETFGRELAVLHRDVETRYGFDGDNFIGRLPQRNAWEVSWPAFFAKHRLAPQVARARQSGRWQRDWEAGFEALIGRLEQLLPEKPGASLLHGDLWGGNFLVTERGPALIDPAAYYGHREVDLAMTQLFGGFDHRFYEAYHEAWPLEAGYEARREIYNLYHVINHLNHFGASYARGVVSVLRRFA